jgi:hypothetical protein
MSGGVRRLWRRSKGLQAIEGCGSGRKFWRRSKVSGGSKHEALETAGSSGGDKRLREGLRGSGGGRRAGGRRIWNGA